MVGSQLPEVVVSKLTVTIEEGVALVHLDDGKANAMSPDFFAELSKGLDEIESSEAKAAVFAGREGFFSAGLDTKLVPTLPADELRFMVEAFARSMLRVWTLDVPTFAACTGHAIAGGAILAMACDRRLNLDGAFRFQMNEVMIGLPVPSWMLAIANSAVAPPWRAEFLMHARAYSPAEACERGIVHRIVGEDVVAAARAEAAGLPALNLAAYATTKERMRRDEAERVLDLLKDELPG